MIDGSHYPINENIAMTKQVVDYVHPRQVSVEGEVGTVEGTEGGLVGGINCADSNGCIRIVKETKIDVLVACLRVISWTISG